MSENVGFDSCVQLFPLFLINIENDSLEIYNYFSIQKNVQRY
jgi:hypothetical protein